jgi:hypothetical protein
MMRKLENDGFGKKFMNPMLPILFLKNSGNTSSEVKIFTKEFVII